MSSKFPLFHLPLVALSIVLNTVELNELLNISLCSKKTGKLSKSVRNKSKRVDITFSNADFEVSIERAFRTIWLFYAFDISELPEGQHEQLNIGDIVVPIRKGRGDSLNTYWEDPFIGITKLLDYVTDFFDSPIHRLELSSMKNREDPRRTVDWTMRRQGSIARIIFMCRKTAEEELRYFLDACKITYDLYLDVPTSEQFNHTINFEMENLTLTHAHWLTLDNLSSLNCRYILIEDYSLTSIDINTYLKNWVNGANSRLGRLTLKSRTNELNIDVILDGLNAVPRTYNKGKVFKVLEKYGHVSPVYFRESSDIRQNDGVMGSIVHDELNGYFEFLVWPDWENQPYP